MSEEVTVLNPSWGTVGAGVALGAAAAISLALAGGIVYGRATA